MLRFSCEKALLQSAVNTVSRAVAAKSSIPALEGILVEGSDRLTMSGYNMQTGIRTAFEAEIHEEGRIVLNARLFGEIIRKLPDDLVVFAADEKYMVRLTCGDASFEIMGLSAEDYPELPEVDDEYSVAIQQGTLKAMINQTSFAVSTNETRPIHTGSLFEINEQGLTMVSVDGFRLDVAHYRNDLWAQIRKGAADFGKKILIIAESGPAIRGVTDILQHGEVISHNYGLNRSHRMLYDAAGYCADRQTRANERYQVKIFYEDGTVQDSSRNHWHQPEKVPEVIEEGACTRTEEGAASAAWQVQTGRLRVENIYGEKAVRNIQIADNQGQLWNSNREGVLEVDYTVSVQKKKNGLLLEFPLRIQDGQRLSIQLSCHDGGWVGFPGEENPYCAQGSRYLAGYTTLLAPGVPVFMSGEEFNADYRPLPQLSPGLFGGEPFGKGRWLYGSWIDWEQLKLPEKTQMLEDMKSIIKIRRSHSELIKPCRMGDTKRNFAAIEYEADRELPIPYCYMEKGRVLLIAANPSAEEDVGMRFRLHEVLETAADNTDSAARWQVSALFGELPGGKERILATADELEKLRWTIKRDLACGGGLLVLEFEAIPGTHSPQPR